MSPERESKTKINIADRDMKKLENEVRVVIRKQSTFKDQEKKK